MFKNKKAQGLSLNTIIIAALVLIVLVVLIMIFTGRMGWFNIGLFNATTPKTCGEMGGTPTPEDQCSIEQRVLVQVSDLEPGEVCCKQS